MAENEQTGGNNLDDFFAKKDKSKKKTKSSKFTVDDILQAKTENEEKSKKVRSKKKEKDPNRSDKVLGVKTEGVMFCSYTGSRYSFILWALSVLTGNGQYWQPLSYTHGCDCFVA